MIVAFSVALMRIVAYARQGYGVWGMLEELAFSPKAQTCVGFGVEYGLMPALNPTPQPNISRSAV